MKRKMKAQGSIELMIIAPVMIFFIYVLYLNGVRLHAVLTAANTNYSDGIAIMVSLGIADKTWEKGWGGHLLTNQVDPHNSRWTNLGDMGSLKYTVAYPVSPFISVFVK